MRGESHIVPLFVGDNAAALALAEAALARGVFVRAIRPPTVPEGTARLRLTPMATHTAAQIAHAVGVFAEAGRHLGITLAYVVCLLNPLAIVVGGGVSQAGDLLLDPIRQEVARRTTVMSPAQGGVAVIQSPLGSEAGAIGSAAWAMRAEGTS